MKQSKQAWLTTISAPVRLTEWLSTLPKETTRLIAHTGLENQEKPTIQSQQPIFLLIGPEGGISDDEFQSALAQGFQPISLGDTILRSETAAVVGTAKVLTSFWANASNPSAAIFFRVHSWAKNLTFSNGLFIL